MPTVRIQEKNYSESIMVLKLKDGPDVRARGARCHKRVRRNGICGGLSCNKVPIKQKK